MKKLFFIFIFMLFSIVSYSLTISEISGNYKLVLGVNNGDIPQILEFDITLENTSIYYIYEKRIIGGKVWLYPVIVDTFYIDGDNNVILNADAQKVILVYANGILTGFLKDSNMSITLAKDVTLFSYPCSINILELDTNGSIPSTKDIARFLISTNKKTCSYFPSITNASLSNYELLDTGDSIVTIDTSDTSSGSLVRINVSGVIFEIIKD